MKKEVIGTVAVTVVLIAVSVAQVFAAPSNTHSTPYDSFLWTQENTVSGLVNEIKYSPKIATRYAKLYHVSPETVVNYFRNYLELKTLSKPLKGPVYCVRPDGSIFVTRTTLKAGTKIFALRDNRPVLEWTCGNPLTSSLPPNPPKREMSGNVDFSGGKAKRRRAALVPSNGNGSGRQGQPLQLSNNHTWTPANTVTPVEFVSPYVSTFNDVNPPTDEGPIGGPEDFNFPVEGYSPSGIPFGSVFGFLPLTFGSFFGSHSSGGAGFSPVAAPEASGLVAWPTGIALFSLLAYLRSRRQTSR